MSKRSTRKAPHEASPIHVGNGHTKRSRGIALSLNRILVVLFIVVFGGIGTYFIFTSHADTVDNSYPAIATKACVHSEVDGGCHIGDGYATGASQNICPNASDFIAPNPNDGRPDCFKAQDASTITYACKNSSDRLNGSTCTPATTAAKPAPAAKPAITCSHIDNGTLCTDGTITCAAGYAATLHQTCTKANGTCQHIPNGKNCEAVITCDSGYIVRGSQCIAQPKTQTCWAIANGRTCSDGTTTCTAGYIATAGNTCAKANGTCQHIPNGKNCEGKVTCDSGYIQSGSRCVVQPSTVTCRTIAYGTTCSNGVTTCTAGYIATAGNTCAKANGTCQHIPNGKNCKGRITCNSGYAVSGSRCVTPQAAASAAAAAAATSKGCVTIQNGKNCKGRITCNSGYHQSGFTCEKAAISNRVTSTAATTKSHTSTTKSTTTKATGSKAKTAKDNTSSARGSSAECGNGHWYTTGNGGGKAYYSCVSGKWKAVTCANGQVAVASTSNSGPCETVRSHGSGATSASTHTKQAANICGTIAHAKTCVRHEDGSVVVLTCEPKWQPDGEQCASVVVSCFGQVHAKLCEKIGGTTMIIACYSGYNPNTDNTVCMSSARGDRGTTSPAGSTNAKVTASKICGEPGAPTGFGQCSDPTNHQCGAHGQWKYNGASGCGCQAGYTGAACSIPPKKPSQPKSYTVSTVSCSSVHVAHGKKCENVGDLIVVAKCVTPGYKVNASQTGCDTTAKSSRGTAGSKSVSKGQDASKDRQLYCGIGALTGYGIHRASENTAYIPTVPGAANTGFEEYSSILGLGNTSAGLQLCVKPLPNYYYKTASQKSQYTITYYFCTGSSAEDTKKCPVGASHTATLKSEVEKGNCTVVNSWKDKVGSKFFSLKAGHPDCYFRVSDGANTVIPTKTQCIEFDGYSIGTPDALTGLFTNSKCSGAPYLGAG